MDFLRKLFGKKVEPLIADLKNGDRIVRRGAVESLYKMESDKGMASVLILLADDDYNVRFNTLDAMDSVRPSSEILQSHMPGMEATIPADDTVTRVRLHCGLGIWLQQNTKGWPAAEQEFREAIRLAPELGVSHVLLGDFLMGKSSKLHTANEMS